MALKPGIKTSEFYGIASASAAPWFVNTLPPTWKVVVSAACWIGYAIARAIAKRAHGGDGK